MLQQFNQFTVRNRKGTRKVKVSEMSNREATKYTKVKEACQKAIIVPGFHVLADGRIAIVQYVDKNLQELLISCEDDGSIGVVGFEHIEQFAKYVNTPMNATIHCIHPQ